MHLKTPIIVFFVALSGIPFISSIHAVSKSIVVTPIVDPGFPPAGEEPFDATITPSQTVPPLAVFEEAVTSTTDSVIPSPTPSFTLEEVLVISKKSEATPSSPRLVIPSIHLDVAIGSVGLTASGNMDVLNNPNKVSWYRGGVAPGEKGSAVIGAHVFQSFAKLQDVNLGDSIYVERVDGRKLRFIVSEIEEYPYTATEPLPKIFSRSDKVRLNLITCDGELTADHSTYDHRLVVFAELKD